MTPADRYRALYRFLPTVNQWIATKRTADIGMSNIIDTAMKPFIGAPDVKASLNSSSMTLSLSDRMMILSASL